MLADKQLTNILEELPSVDYLNTEAGIPFLFGLHTLITF